MVLAGGGTAGHIEPAMAVADALVALAPGVRITALGTARGLETRLVPERGYDLELITPVPLPRKPSGDLARLPLRVRTAVRQTRAILDRVDADVVIGFVISASDLDAASAVCSAALDDRLAWIAYPKSRQLGTDLNRDSLAALVAARGARPVRSVSIDGIWSAIRFRPL